MMFTKKVLVIGMSAHPGGIESFFINVFRNINKDIIKFDFITFFPTCAFEDELKAAGCEVYHITRRGKNPIKNFCELTAFFKKHNTEYDYIWYHTSSSSNIEPLVIAKKHSTAKTIVHCHGTNFESSKLARPIHIILQKLNFNKMRKSTDFPFACSKAAANHLFKDAFGKVRIINNGIDVDSYKFNPQTRQSVRNELGINDLTTVIGHAGRLCEIKNQKFLIESFYEYQKINPDSVLAIAGDGALKEELQNLTCKLNIQDKVKFLGFRNDLNRLLQAFDLFALTSFSEGFPVTLIEAQAAGLGCIVSDTVTKEVAITDLVDFVSLESGSEKWAKEIENIIVKYSQLRNNIDYSLKVKDAFFDVKDNAKAIEKFFIKEDR